MEAVWVVAQAFGKNAEDTELLVEEKGEQQVDERQVSGDCNDVTRNTG